MEYVYFTDHHGRHHVKTFRTAKWAIRFTKFLDICIRLDLCGGYCVTNLPLPN